MSIISSNLETGFRNKCVEFICIINFILILYILYSNVCNLPKLNKYIHIVYLYSLKILNF